MPVASSARQKLLRKQTESLRRQKLRPCADFVAKVLREAPKLRRSDRASNMIPRSAVVRNGIPRIRPIGTRILSVNAALDVRQDTDRLLQQNLPEPEVPGRQQAEAHSWWAKCRSAPCNWSHHAGCLEIWDSGNLYRWASAASVSASGGTDTRRKACSAR